MKLKLITSIISLLLFSNTNVFAQFRTFEENNLIKIQEPISLKDFGLKGKVKSYTKEDKDLNYSDIYKFNEEGYIRIKERKFSDSSHNSISYYSYYNNNNFIKIQYSDGLSEDNLYYENKRCVKRKYIRQNEKRSYETYKYNSKDNSIQIDYYDNRDSVRKIHNLVYDKNNNLIMFDGENTSKNKYDKNNNLVLKKEYNNKYKFIYNKQNQLIKVSCYNKRKLFKEINYTYDSLGNNIKTSSILDPVYYGYITKTKEKIKLNDNGKLREIKRYYVDSKSKNSFKYNDKGSLIKETYKCKTKYEQDYRDEYTYDKKNNLIEKREYKENLYNKSFFKFNNLDLNKIEKYFYNDKNQNNIIITYYNPDWINNIDSIYYLQNTLKGLQNTYSYSNLDSTFSIIRTDTFRYDNRNRLVNHSFRDFDDITIDDYTYNDFDSIVYISNKLFRKKDTIPFTRYFKRTFNPKGIVIEEENTRDNHYYSHIFSYDDKGRLKVVTDKEDNRVRQVIKYSKNGKRIERLFHPKGKYNFGSITF